MIFCVSAVILTAMLSTMAKWGFDMINREEHKRLLEEIERLKAKNEELELAEMLLRDEMLMLRDMLVSVRSRKIARMYE